MSFAYPLGLLGLLSLPVILALHLLRERQRRYVVSHLDLWSFLEQSVTGPRIRRLPLTLILLLDLLAAALFSLAWAQPRLDLRLPLPSAKQQVIVIDVSSSMRAMEGLTSRFERAKAAAVDVVEDSGAQDRVTLVAFGRRARLIAGGAPVADAALLEQISALRVGETGTAQALQEALALGLSTLDPQLPAEFTVITDGSFSFEREAALAGFAHPLNWRFIGTPQDNQAVISLNITRLDETRYQVFTRVANFGGRTTRRGLALAVSGKTINQVNLDIPADSSVTHLWQVTIPANSGPAATLQVALEGDDRLPADDTAAIGLQPAGKVRVALVADQPGALQQAIQAIPGAELTLIPPADYAEDQAMGAVPGRQGPESFELTIFRGYVPPVWPDGLALVVDPPREDDPAGLESAWYAGSRQEIPANAALHTPNPSPLVEGIDFGGVRWSRAWRLAGTSNGIPPGFVPLLQANETPLLLMGGVAAQAAGSGRPAAGALPVTGLAGGGFSRVVVLLADLSFGNFTKHPAFPILMAKLVEFARQAPAPPGFLTGEAAPLPAPGSYQTVQVIPPGQAPVTFENSWPGQWQDTLEPGLYQFRFFQRGGETVEFAAGAWAGEAMESDLRPRPWTGRSEPGSAGAGRRPGSAAEDAAHEIDLRPWLLGAALLLLLWEAYLAWRR